MEFFFKKVVIVLLSFSMVVGPQISAFFRGGEQAFSENWSADRPFTREYAAEIEKDLDRDFVILNLADLQLTDREALGDMGALVKRNTDRIVRETQPDLITLTGDNAWGEFAYVELIKLIDSYGIPWAPVLGNHDEERCPSAFWCAYNLSKAKHCLFRFGPAGMGHGNYIVNITQNGEILHSLFFMDTHTEIAEENLNGTPGDKHFDHLWENQMEWYAWGVDGIRALAGRTVESTVIFHIPLYEYKTAWEEATGNEPPWNSHMSNKYHGEYAETNFGIRCDPGGWPEKNNGFFTLLREKDSTKNVLCGHDHANNYSILYQGIRLSFSLKDGPGCYWIPSFNGGTTLTVDETGSVTVAHHYVPFDETAVDTQESEPWLSFFGLS